MGTRRKICLWLCGAVGCLLAAGCEERIPRPSPPPASSGGVTVSMIDKAGYDRLLAQNRGKVVLVDFWATWCGPCKELFPHTVAMQRRYADDGLTVVTMSLDDPDDKARVLEFLKSQAATTQNFIEKGGGTPQPMEDYQIDDGAIPHLKVYDRQGKLRGKIQGARPTEVERVVRELLNEK